MQPAQFLPREDVRRLIGSMVMFGFDGQGITAELRALWREISPSGLILFARNVESPAQVRELVTELQSAAPAPMLVGVDQEGGRVQRIRNGATSWPAMRALGALDDPAFTDAITRAMARELSAMGFSLSFAPVLDVDSNPNNPVIGDRAFSSDPRIVARHGAIVTRVLQDSGVSACGKHFPGHGDTNQDSHHTLPRVAHAPKRLRQVEWPPFAFAIQAGLSSIMTAHVVMEYQDEHPATLSRRALLPLRDELGFRGIILSDDMEMKAVAERYSVAQMAELGILAGIDVFLACHEPAFILELYRALVQLVERGILSHEELQGRARRVQAWVHRFSRGPLGDISIVGCAAHQELANVLPTHSR